MSVEQSHSIFTYHLFVMVFNGMSCFTKSKKSDSKKPMRPIKPNQGLFSSVLNSFLGELKKLLKYKIVYKKKKKILPKVW